ncbi:hypothetical protein HPP92_013304 [Vanilla planifolia]|uniref:Uncharacterized protein n=1 Tax=Vanilla planifolia TaxID=51239 RepID=A0A835UZV7_VANPL|nr:hypothetical protein HPP92_013304 [Vanilla planifolia]
MVDSRRTGRLSMLWSGHVTSSRRWEMDGRREGRKRRLPGEARKETQLPFLARRLESSKKGRDDL